MKTNTLRKAISIISALTMSAACLPAAFAAEEKVDVETVEQHVFTGDITIYNDETYEDILAKYIDDELVYEYGDDYSRHALIIKKDGTTDCIEQMYPKVYFGFDKSAEPDNEKLQELIGERYLYNKSKNWYWFYQLKNDIYDNAEIKNIYEQLSKLEGINIIQEEQRLALTQHVIDGIIIDSGRSGYELEKELSYLGISYSAQSSGYSPNIAPDKKYFKWEYKNEPESYDKVAKLFQSGLNFEIVVGIPELAHKTTVNTVYRAEINYGDLDGDQSVDLSDLTSLSQYILRDITLTEQQQKNADVNADGEVDISDLALLKQYVMNDDVKLGAVS